MAMARQLPLKMGPDGGVSDNGFKLLELTSKCQSNLQKKQVMNNTSITRRLFEQLLQELEINFKATVCNPDEERRLRCTTIYNLNLWFEKWKDFLVTTCQMTKRHK